MQENALVDEMLREFVNQPCTRLAIGEYTSLSIGFGELQPPTGKQSIRYGKWEIGTYFSGWRIMRGGEVILGRYEYLDSEIEFQAALESIRFGSLAGIERRVSDMIVTFDSGIAVEFMPLSSHPDESFHIFFPNDRHLAFYFRRGFVISSTGRGTDSENG